MSLCNVDGAFLKLATLHWARGAWFFIKSFAAILINLNIDIEGRGFLNALSKCFWLLAFYVRLFKITPLNTTLRGLAIKLMGIAGSKLIKVTCKSSSTVGAWRWVAEEVGKINQFEQTGRRHIVDLKSALKLIREVR